YGGVCGAANCNDTWAYDVPTRTWTQKALNTTPPSPFVAASATDEAGLAYNPVNHTVLYHQTAGAGAPSDWLYDPSADTWTKLTSVGTGPERFVALSYDKKNNVLVGWTQDPIDGSGRIWQGCLGSGGQ